MKKFNIIIFSVLGFNFATNSIQTKSSVNEKYFQSNKNSEIHRSEMTYDERDIEALMNLDLPAPKLENPSRLKVWIREKGIDFIHKFYSFKNWLIKKYQENFYNMKIMKYLK